MNWIRTSFREIPERVLVVRYFGYRVIFLSFSDFPGISNTLDTFGQVFYLVSLGNSVIFDEVCSDSFGQFFQVFSSILSKPNPNQIRSKIYKYLNGTNIPGSKNLTTQKIRSEPERVPEPLDHTTTQVIFYYFFYKVITSNKMCYIILLSL